MDIQSAMPWPPKQKILKQLSRSVRGRQITFSSGVGFGIFLSDFFNLLPRSQCKRLARGVSNTEPAEIHKSTSRAYHGMQLASGGASDESAADG